MLSPLRPELADPCPQKATHLHLRARSPALIPFKVKRGQKNQPLDLSPSFLQTEIIRKRLNKDIPHHPVVMLNFCPDLRTVQPDLRKAQGEFIFLIDRSRSMSGVNINRVKVPRRREGACVPMRDEY